MDFVRLETASALKRDIPVVPVLVHGARMPRAEELPEDLKELAFRNAVELTHARWDSDVEVLVKALQPYVQAKEERRRPRPALWMIIGVSFGVLILAFGGYVWQQKSSVEAARVAAAQAEQRRSDAAKEEKARADADRMNNEKIAAEQAQRVKEKEAAELAEADRINKARIAAAAAAAQQAKENAGRAEADRINKAKIAAAAAAAQLAKENAGRAEAENRSRLAELEAQRLADYAQRAREAKAQAELADRQAAKNVALAKFKVDAERIAWDFKAARDKCFKSLAGNERDGCVAEAVAGEKRARATAVAEYKRAVPAGPASH